MKFRDQVVLVTGGGSGIGRATARAFAREGAVVVVAGRRAEPLAETAKLIEADGGVADQVTADVTDEGDAARMVAEIVARHGRLDVASKAAVSALDEIAAAVLYLASPEAGYAVGTDLVIDGGASA